MASAAAESLAVQYADDETAWQLSKTAEPRGGTLRKFAEAAGITIKELVAGKWAGKK